MSVQTATTSEHVSRVHLLMTHKFVKPGCSALCTKPRSTFSLRDRPLACKRHLLDADETQLPCIVVCLSYTASCQGPGDVRAHVREVLPWSLLSRHASVLTGNLCSCSCPHLQTTDDPSSIFEPKSPALSSFLVSIISEQTASETKNEGLL